MPIHRLFADTVNLVEPGRWLNRGAVRNAADAVARDEAAARVREDTRHAVERAVLTARLMSRSAG